MLERNRLRNLRQGNGIFSVLDLRDRMEDLENPFSPGKALLNRVVDIRQSLDRFVQEEKSRYEGNKRTRGRCPP